MDGIRAITCQPLFGPRHYEPEGPKHPPPSGDSLSRNHGKARVVGQRVMPFVRINAATAVSRHVTGCPSCQTTDTKGNMSRRVCGWGGATRTPVAFGSRTSLVRL
jgi:hypothetical protein